jgi:hypothetical protein
MLIAKESDCKDTGSSGRGLMARGDLRIPLRQLLWTLKYCTEGGCVQLWACIVCEEDVWLFITLQPNAMIRHLTKRQPIKSNQSVNQFCAL